MSWATISSMSWSARDADWTADFQEWNGSAVSNTFKMDAPRLRRGQEDKETVAPILESILRVRVKDTSRFLHNKLQSTDYENLRLLIQRGGSDWGSYILYKKDGGDQIVYDNPVLKLRFEGGLRRLKKLTWDDRGEHELLRILSHIFAETRAQFPTRVYTEWRSTNADLTSRDEAQAIQLDAADLAQNRSVPNYFDVLREILVTFNLQIMQYNGRWHVMQRTYRNQSMDWSERDTGGTESTGTSDLRITQSQAALKTWDDTYPEGRNREAVPAIRRRFVYSKGNFLNPIFTDTYDDLDGIEHWNGWRDSGSVSKSSTGNPKINDSSSYIQQSFDRVFAPNLSGNPDEATLIVSVTLTTQTVLSAPKTVDVPYLEVFRYEKHDGGAAKEWWTPALGWVGSQNFLTINDAQVPGTGENTTTYSFTALPNIVADDTSDRKELVIRATTTVDPDGDGDVEVKSVEWGKVESVMQKNADTPDGETFYVGSSEAQITRETATGSWDPDNQVAGNVRYWDGSAWDKSNSWKYDTAQSVSRAIGRSGVVELESQLNHDLAEVQGAVGHDGATIIDSPEIGGVRYIPSHSDEILTHERRYMEFVEYKNA